MDPAPEREVMPRGRPVENYVVGALVLCWVPVGRAPEEQHGRPFGNWNAIQIRRPGDVAEVVAERRLEPQGLFDKGSHELRVGPQSSLQPWMIGEYVNGIAQKARGRLASGAEQCGHDEKPVAQVEVAGGH